MIRTLIACLFLLAQPALAQDTSAEDAEVKARTEAISKTLRCVVCQNQSIADSNATLAEDMRRLVEARVRAGDTDQDVRDFMQERYGDFVLMEPPVKWYTYALWFGPALLVLLGLVWYVSAMRKPGTVQAAPDEDTALTPEERARLDKLMNKDETE